jgi:hypothetical protein
MTERRALLGTMQIYVTLLEERVWDSVTKCHTVPQISRAQGQFVKSDKIAKKIVKNGNMGF